MLSEIGEGPGGQRAKTYDKFEGNWGPSKYQDIEKLTRTGHRASEPDDA